MAKVHSYRDLIVLQESFDSTREVYERTKSLPKEEFFGLVSQMRRAAVSIPSNIAEGQQRNNLKEYRQFLGIARGSAAELCTQLLLMQEIYKTNTEELVARVENIQKMLYRLLEKLQPVTSNL